MNELRKNSVLIADDHPLYLDALETLVQRTIDLSLLGAVSTMREALDRLSAQPCDVVLLDVRMPGMDGLAGVRQVRELRPEAKIILISGQLDERIVNDGLKLGASGFLSKEYSPETILAAIRLVLTGAVYAPPNLLAQGASPSEPSPRVPGHHANLSERELAVLARLVDGASHKEIARDLGLAEVTVKLHTQRIVRKLGVKNRSAAIVAAVREGIVGPRS